MKAAVCADTGIDAAIEDIAVPVPSAGEVLLQVAACGVCHSDLHVLTGATAFPRPCILGHEVSGIVTETGAGVTNVRKGDRVVASFILPCGACEQCARGRPELCSEFLVKNRRRGVLFDGTSRHRTHAGDPIWMYSMGGLAEYCVVPANDLFKVPDGVDLVAAAVLGCSVFTAYGAVHDVADVGLGDSVAVIGAGGVGSSVIALARAAGAADVIAIDIEEHKLTAAAALGATHTVNAARDDAVAAVREATDGRGVDVCFEAIGDPGTLRTAVDVCGDGGHAVVVGLARPGTPASIDMGRLVRRKLRVSGSYGASPGAAMPAVIRLAAGSRIDLSAIVTDRFTLDEVKVAYQALADRKIAGRGVLVIDTRL